MGLAGNRHQLLQPGLEQVELVDEEQLLHPKRHLLHLGQEVAECEEQGQQVEVDGQLDVEVVEGGEELEPPEWML